MRRIGVGKVANRHPDATIRATPNFYDPLDDAGSSSTTPMQQPARSPPASPLAAPPSSPSPTLSSSTRPTCGPPPATISSSSTRQARGPPSVASTIASASSATPAATSSDAQRPPSAEGRSDVQTQAARARQDKEQRQRSRAIQAIYLREKYPERYGTSKPTVSPPYRAQAATPPVPDRATD